MIHLSDYIENFDHIIANLYGDNIVFAGTNALKIHGLNISREAGDLDLVIYNPTQRQIDYLESIFGNRVPNEHVAAYEDTIQGLKSIKFKETNLDGDPLYLDILLENGKDTPIDLLFFSHDGVYYKIQNIALNIDAKRSYVLKGQEGLAHYARRKDMLDLQDLKNSNFNL